MRWVVPEVYRYTWFAAPVPMMATPGRVWPGWEAFTLDTKVWPVPAGGKAVMSRDDP